MSFRYDIVIPHCGLSRDLTDKCLSCLRSIKRHSKDYRVFLFDNNTPLTYMEPILEELRQHPHFLIRSTRNLGFVHAVNTSLRFTTAPYVVLMNNDTEAAPEWLSKLEEPTHAHPRIGIVGPRTTTPNSWQGRIPEQPGWHCLETSQMVAFFCTLFTREIINEVGFLDESFGVGLGDDDMYCFKAHKLGWRIALVTDLLIRHHHRSTFHAMYGVEKTLEMQYQALAMFKDKRRES